MGSVGEMLKNLMLTGVFLAILVWTVATPGPGDDIGAAGLTIISSWKTMKSFFQSDSARPYTSPYIRSPEQMQYFGGR